MQSIIVLAVLFASMSILYTQNMSISHQKCCTATLYTVVQQMCLLFMNALPYSSQVFNYLCFQLSLFPVLQFARSRLSALLQGTQGREFFIGNTFCVRFGVSHADYFYISNRILIRLLNIIHYLLFVWFHFYNIRVVPYEANLYYTI